MEIKEVGKIFTDGIFIYYFYNKSKAIEVIYLGNKLSLSDKRGMENLINNQYPYTVSEDNRYVQIINSYTGNRFVLDKRDYYQTLIPTLKEFFKE